MGEGGAWAAPCTLFSSSQPLSLPASPCPPPPPLLMPPPQYSPAPHFTSPQPKTTSGLQSTNSPYPPKNRGTRGPQCCALLKRNRGSGGSQCCAPSKPGVCGGPPCSAPPTRSAPQGWAGLVRATQEPPPAPRQPPPIPSSPYVLCPLLGVAPRSLGPPGPPVALSCCAVVSGVCKLIKMEKTSQISTKEMN